MAVLRAILLFCLLQPHFLVAQQPKLIVPVGHTGNITSFKQHREGKFYITVSEGIFSDNTVKGWDGKTGKLLYSIEHQNPVVFNAAVTCFATLANQLNSCIVRSAQNGEELYRINLKEEEFYSVLFNPISDVIATISISLTSANTYLTAWQHPGGKMIFKKTLGTGGIGYLYYKPLLQFSRDGKYVFAASAMDSVLGIWNFQTGKLLRKLQVPKIGASKLVFPEKGNLFLQQTNLDTVHKIWDMLLGKSICSVTSDDLAPSFTFSSDNKYLLVQSSIRGGIFKVLEVRTGKIIYEQKKDLAEDGWWYMAAAFSRDGQLFFDNDTGQVTRARDFKTGRTMYYLRDTINNKPIPQNKILPSADGKYIITESVINRIKVWNSTTGEFLYILDKSTNAYDRELQFSEDNNYLIGKKSDGTIDMWNYRKGVKVTSLSCKAGGSEITAADISADGQYSLACHKDGMIRLWQNEKGRIIYSIQGHRYNIRTIRFSKDRRFFLTASDDQTVRYWYTETGKLLHTFRHPSAVSDAEFSPDDQSVVTACLDGSARIWKLYHFSPEHVLAGHPQYLKTAKYSPDGKYIITTSGNNTVKIWQSSNAQLLFDEEIKTHFIYNAEYRPDGKEIVANSYNGYILWQVGSNDSIGSMQSFGPYREVELSYQYGPDGNAVVWVGDSVMVLDRNRNNLSRYYFPEGKHKMRFSTRSNQFVSSFNASLNIYDADKYRLRSKLIALDSSEWFCQVPSGYYYGSLAAIKKLHYVSKDSRIISFEQLDVKYNRPDKVLEAIGNTDTALIKSYRKAWEKRIKKLGIDTTAFKDGYSVPECDFVNRDAVKYEQKTGFLSLRIKGYDSTYKLDRFNIWVNESPLYGQRGINIRRKKRNSIDTTITIVLSQGENRIECSITNVNGTESYRMPLYVNYTPAVKQRETVHFIGIGIDQFKESSYNLQYSSKDIRDLAVKLKEKYKDNITIDTLFNEKVTTENVKALKQKLQQTTVNDKVILSYSGHGLLSKEYDYYLSTYTVNFGKPEENGLPYDELENLLDNIPARKKLMLIDACHSGEVDKEEGIAMNKAADSLGLSKGIIIDQPQQQQHVGLKNSFELMQSLFVNVGKSTGATIISAAAGNQFALERGDLKNGVFTYSILEAMNKYPTLKISELKRIVGDRVQQLTNGLQKPTSRNENISVDWELW